MLYDTTFQGLELPIESFFNVQDCMASFERYSVTRTDLIIA